METLMMKARGQSGSTRPNQEVINEKWAVNLLPQESYDGFSTPMNV